MPLLSLILSVQISYHFNYGYKGTTKNAHTQAKSVFFQKIPLPNTIIYYARRCPVSRAPTPYSLTTNLSYSYQLREGVRRNALRVLRPKSPHSEEIAQYIEWRDLRGPRPIS